MIKVLVVLSFCISALAQSPSYPLPYISAGGSLMPAGYASAAFNFGGGIMMDTRYFVLDSYAGYDTGHKDNDGTTYNQDNNKGHDRYLRGLASYKHGNAYFGVGARWSELSTSNYIKGGTIFTAGAWHPVIGAGYDFLANDKFYPLFMRGQVTYFFKESKESIKYPNGTTCDGCGNGSNGIDLSLWFPSPARKHRLFLRMNFTIFGYHDTITEPYNTILTQEQIANKHITMADEFMLLWRF